MLRSSCRSAGTVNLQIDILMEISDNKTMLSYITQYKNRLFVPLAKAYSFSD